jgi:hypothetical protein
MNIMEKLLEYLGWIAVGFVPTLLCLEMSWKMGSKMTDKRRRMTTGILQQTTIRGKIN